MPEKKQQVVTDFDRLRARALVYRSWGFALIFGSILMFSGGFGLESFGIIHTGLGGC